MRHEWLFGLLLLSLVTCWACCVFAHTENLFNTRNLMPQATATSLQLCNRVLVLVKQPVCVVT
jgi:hypothetical protein